MKPIDLEYQPPDDAERKRRDQPISPASVVAGGFLGFFFTPMLWAYASLFARKGDPRAMSPIEAEVIAAVVTVTLAILGGRHIERLMPDARGMAIGLIVSAALIAAGGIVLGVFAR